MPAAPHLRLVKSDNDAAAVPPIPSVDVAERPSPLVSAVSGRAFIGVVALSLFIHGVIIAASIDWSVVDEERGAGSGDATVTIEGIDVILLDRMPSVRPPLTAAEFVDQNDPAQPLEGTPAAAVEPRATTQIPTDVVAPLDATAQATTVTDDAVASTDPHPPANITTFEPAAPASDMPIAATGDAQANVPSDQPDARIVAADRLAPPTTEKWEPITTTEPARAVEAEAAGAPPVAAATTADSTEARTAAEALDAPAKLAEPAGVTTAGDTTAQPVDGRSPADTSAVAATSPPASAAAPVAAEDLPSSAATDRTVAAEPVPAPPIPPKRPDPPPATAPPAPAANAPTATAPARANAGSGGRTVNAAGKAELSRYRSRLAAHLRRFQAYPEAARRRRIEGTARVTITINRQGRVVAVSLAKGTGHAILDRAALAMVRRASPFPAMPAKVGGSQMTFRAPIRFAVR